MIVNVISMIRVTYNRGNGTKENPIRNIHSYHLPSGKFLVEHDPATSKWNNTQRHGDTLKDKIEEA